MDILIKDFHLTTQFPIHVNIKTSYNSSKEST